MNYLDVFFAQHSNSSFYLLGVRPVQQVAPDVPVERHGRHAGGGRGAAGAGRAGREAAAASVTHVARASLARASSRSRGRAGDEERRGKG